VKENFYIGAVIVGYQSINRNSRTGVGPRDISTCRRENHGTSIGWAVGYDAGVGQLDAQLVTSLK